ncbi:MAG: MBL fold metallo-hydrolase [Candidatus Binatia bacterium]
MATVTEIAPEIFRISTYVPEFGLQFGQFLVRDEEPLLFHTGLRRIFPGVHEAVAKLIDPSRLRWISFSHFESDESGALNEWLDAAPNAEAACSMVGALVNVDDFALRPARQLADGEVLETGNRRFRFLRTPHVPHCWEAGLLFEETTSTLFCSDLFDQGGDVEPLAESGVLERHRESLLAGQAGPFANYLPWTPNTEPILRRLAALRPKVLATMHGSVFRGDGERLLRAEIDVLRDVFGRANVPA